MEPVGRSGGPILKKNRLRLVLARHGTLNAPNPSFSCPTRIRRLSDGVGFQGTSRSSGFEGPPDSPTGVSVAYPTAIRPTPTRRPMSNMAVVWPTRNAQRETGETIGFQLPLDTLIKHSHPRILSSHRAQQSNRGALSCRAGAAWSELFGPNHFHSPVHVPSPA